MPLEPRSITQSSSSSVHSASSSAGSSSTTSEAEDADSDSIGSDGVIDLIDTKHQDRFRLKRKRQQQLEDEMDQYMEEMDQKARVQEEAVLLSILNDEPAGDIKRQDIDCQDNNAPQQPKVLRKSLEDVHRWHGTYKAEWDRYGGVVSEEEFREVERRRTPKRSRRQRH